MLIIRRKDNHLICLAWGPGPGLPVDSFDTAIYEQVTGDLPEGWEQESPPLTTQQQLDAVFMNLPATLRGQFYPLKAAVKLALDQGDTDGAHAVIQNATVPPELQPLKDQMLKFLVNP